MSNENPAQNSANEPGEQPQAESGTPRTRREVLASAMGLTGTIAGAASLLGSRSAHAQVAGLPGGVTAPDPLNKVPSVRIPAAITNSLGSPIKQLNFEGPGLDGAQVFARLCKEEELAALFCCPGNYPVINAIAEVGIPSFGGRTEGGMCAMADGFSRATGEVVAASGTEGPGFTHMIMNIAAAGAARTPLLVLASNASISGEDNEALQNIYQQPMTETLRKYGKRLIVPNRVWEYGQYAFRQLKSGVPGVVHLDFPGEVARERFPDPHKLTCYYEKDKYRSESRCEPSAADMQKAIDMIVKAERPILIAGQGVFQRKAWEPLLAAAERHEVAIVGSGPTRGHVPDDHRLNASMSHDAMFSADLVVFIGQYCMPKLGEYRFNPDAKAIRVHPVPEELGRNWPLALGIVSDEKAFIEQLANRLPAKKRDTWVAELAAAKKKYWDTSMDYYKKGLGYSKSTNSIHPYVMAKEIHDFLYEGAIDPKLTLTGWGGATCGHATARFLRANRAGQEIVCQYSFGAMGPDLAMMIGASLAKQRGVGPQAAYKGAPSLCVTSDAGIAYSLFELDTALKYKVPIITVVFNNNCWGMWPSAEDAPRAMHMYLFQENLRYDKMAEGLGARGEYVRTPEQLREALKRSYRAAETENACTLINVQSLAEFSSSKLFAPAPFFGAEPGVGACLH
ncbi:MAG TPA: thiamine pyrophosphate-binding protein [Steroidobacteraceae bacterium]|jgi:thiamine pyrophosphate-dependent acetolactate synthase large subunit-like protein